MTRRTELFDQVRISNIPFRNNNVHQYTIKVHKKINNLKSLKFEDYFMRNHYTVYFFLHSAKKIWYISRDEGDARGARPVSVRRDWFFYLWKIIAIDK